MTLPGQWHAPTPGWRSLRDTFVSSTAPTATIGRRRRWLPLARFRKARLALFRRTGSARTSRGRRRHDPKVARSRHSSATSALRSKTPISSTFARTLARSRISAGLRTRPPASSRAPASQTLLTRRLSTRSCRPRTARSCWVASSALTTRPTRKPSTRPRREQTSAISWLLRAEGWFHFSLSSCRPVRALVLAGRLALQRKRNRISAVPEFPSLRFVGWLFFSHL
mmetsp:Transcript_10204/g.25886  ORF Transcript_10204/g.25886 Transcript_10204/m.25886 type:complete len:225 (+) Transcript_10204:573-1247(+)